MAIITITIPTVIDSRVINSYCRAHGYQANIPDPVIPGATIPNPETRPAFAKRKIIEHIKDSVKLVEIDDATQAARKSASDAVDRDITLS
jgi:hypothetical protein